MSRLRESTRWRYACPAGRRTPARRAGHRQYRQPESLGHVDDLQALWRQPSDPVGVVSNHTVSEPRLQIRTRSGSRSPRHPCWPWGSGQGSPQPSSLDDRQGSLSHLFGNGPLHRVLLCPCSQGCHSLYSWKDVRRKPTSRPSILETPLFVAACFVETAASARADRRPTSAQHRSPASKRGQGAPTASSAGTTGARSF